MDINYPEVLTAFYHYIIYMHIKKSLQKLICTKKKNHLPERGIELTTLQISQKQGELDLNAITTWPPSLLFLRPSNLKIVQYATKFH